MEFDNYGDDLIVKTTRNKQYSYVMIDEFLFCIDQKPSVVAWILFFKREELLSIKPWRRRNYSKGQLQYYRHCWNTFIRNAVNLRRFLSVRDNHKETDTVTLPVYGNLAIPVHKGYKIFDIANGIVTKMFDREVEMKAVEKEIGKVKRASELDFAPHFEGSDHEERWYREEFVSASVAEEHRSSDSKTILRAFRRDIISCMNEIILLDKVYQEDCDKYIRDIVAEIENTGYAGNRLDEEEKKMFQEFVKKTADLVEMNDQKEIYKVLSHGDLCPANILNSKDGVRVIDWESIGFRSFLFDFYSYFYHRPVSSNFKVRKLVYEVDEALGALLNNLDSQTLDPGKIKKSINVYRYIYYLEQLLKLVKRDLTDNNLDMNSYVFRYIKAFEEYEELLSQRD